MSDVKPIITTSEQALRSNFSCRDGKKLASRLWNQEELLNKKRRWLMGLPALPTPDGSKKMPRRPKFLADLSLTESYLRSDEVSSENVRTIIERNFGSCTATQRKHHVVQDYIHFFETLNMESYSTNPSDFLDKLYSMINVLNNNALCLLTDLITNQNIGFKKTRPRMKKIIKDHLPMFLEELTCKDCRTLVERLSEIFKEPSNFQKQQLTILTPVSPSLLSSIQQALQEIDEMPFQDLTAMSRRLRDAMVPPQFPPPRLSSTKDLLLVRVKKRCQKILSTLKEGEDLPKPFAKALSVVKLSLKQQTMHAEITTSEFYPFSPEIIGLQNDILGALWSLPKVRIHELKALQLLVDPEARIPKKTFRIALRKYLMDYLFYCDVVDIPDKVLGVLASLNRKSRRKQQTSSARMMDEDVEATLAVSSQLKQTVLNLLPDDTIDEKLEGLGSDDGTGSNDFDLADTSYFSIPTNRGRGFCLDDRVEGTGDSGVAFCSGVDSNQRHSQYLSELGLIGDIGEHHVAGNIINNLPIVEEDNVNHINLSEHYPQRGSVTRGTRTNHHSPDLAFPTDGLDRNAPLDSIVDMIPSQDCPDEALGTADMRETIIQEICDETSLVAYRLIGHMLDKYLLIEGRDANQITRYYLRGGSPPDSSGIKETISSSKEDVGTSILVQSVQEVLPTMPKSCMERVKMLMD